MASPGRKPIPTKLKLLTGNPGKQKLPVGEPDPDCRIPDPPTCFDAYALEEWNRITPVLLSLGIISDLTVAAVIAYCDSYSDWRTAREALNELKLSTGDPKSGLIQKTSNGNIIMNQMHLVAKAARAEMVKQAAEFGGTEAAKSRLAITGRGKKSKFDGLTGGG